MSSQTIEMRFKEIENLTAGLKELARKLGDVAEEEIMQTICSIKAEWNSECADVLMEKEVKIAAGLSEEAVKLNALAVEMENQAKKMYQLELVNIQLGVKRIY